MAFVNVWYPTLRKTRDIKENPSGGGGVYSVVDNVGHASLTLERASTPSYVSWWPNVDHTSYGTPTYSEDIYKEGGQPSVSIKLDCLDEDSIMHWWNRVKFDGSAFPYDAEYFPTDNKWTLDRTNCSHMVWMALKIGGSEKYATLVRWGMEIVTPPQIHLYAERVRISAALKSFGSK